MMESAKSTRIHHSRTRPFKINLRKKYWLERWYLF